MSSESLLFYQRVRKLHHDYACDHDIHTPVRLP